MNWKRIVAGGMLAGLVMNVAELGFEPLLAPEMEALFTRLGLPTPGEGAMVAVAVSTFALGIVAIWLYAAIERQYGRGKTTAGIAGVATWALSCLLPNVVLYAFGLFTVALFWLATVCPLIGSVAGTLAGAWLYRWAPGSAPVMVQAHL